MSDLPFHPKFQCHVRSLGYDYMTHVGRLVMGEISCTDMSGCIEVFKTIDPDVQQIQTIQLGSDGSSHRDTVYTRVGSEWKASIGSGGQLNG